MLKKLKIELVNKYKVKNLEEIKTNINWNIICNITEKTLKIDKLFIRN